MAVFVKHIGCPRCGSSDANAVYSNGSTYCFSCGSVSGATRAGWVDEEPDDAQVVRVPDDATTDFPEVVVKWLQPTTVTIEELIKHGYFFTASRGGRLGRVLETGRPWPPSGVPAKRPVLERFRPARSGLPSDGIPAIEYRNFSTQSEKRSGFVSKAQFIGSKEDARAQAGNHLLQRRSCLVIVEDSLSSIRVARHCCSEPLFGSSVSNNKLSRMVEGIEEIIVWLDADKYRNAVDIASRCSSLGKKARAVVTELDPKYVDNIPEVLQ